MAFEELDPEIAAFFEKGGQLPTTTDLSTGETGEEGDEAAAAAAAQTAEEAAAAAKTATDAAVVTPAPQPPASNPYLERLLEESQARQDALKQELDALKAREVAANAPKAPDQNTDPLGYLAFKIEEGQRATEALKEQLLEAQKATATNSQVATFMEAVNNQVSAFMKDHADYPKAYEHLVNLRMEEYRMRGMTQKQADEALNVEQTQIAQSALTTGKNVGEVVYTLAKKYGYQAPATTAAPTTPESKLDTLKKGLETGTPVERSTPETSVTPANVRQMSERELNELVADEDKWAKLMGHAGKGII
jgi:hypothetical protein